MWDHGHNMVMSQLLTTLIAINIPYTGIWLLQSRSHTQQTRTVDKERTKCHNYIDKIAIEIQVYTGGHMFIAIKIS